MAPNTAPNRWGPFTGRQLTLIIVAIVFAIAAIPVTAQATSTGQDVVITDPTASPERYAKVDSSGQLTVKDNHLKTDIFGALRVAPIYGNVTARSASLSDAFAGWVHILPPNKTAELVIAGPKPVVVTRLHVSGLTNVNGGEFLLDIYGPTTTCSSSTPKLERVTSTFSATTELSYDPGLVIPATQRLCARVGDITAVQFDVSVGVSGFIDNS